MNKKKKNLIVLAILLCLVAAFYFITIQRIKSGIWKALANIKHLDY